LDKSLQEEWKNFESRIKPEDREYTKARFVEAYTAAYWYDGPNIDVNKLDLKKVDEPGEIIDYVYLQCGEHGLSKLTLTEEQIGTPEKPYRYYICEAEGRLSEGLLDWGWRVELAEKQPGILTGQFNGLALTNVPILIDLTLDLKTRELTIKGWGWITGTLSIET